MTRKHYLIAALSVLALTSWAIASDGRAEDPAGHSMGTAHPMQMMHQEGAMVGDAENMPEACKEMMQERKAMMSRTADLDAALQEKLAAAKEARGDAKVAALTEVVETLVDQRKELRAYMMGGMSGMMGHMMSRMHGSQGDKGGTHTGMADCPMMGGAHSDGGDEGAAPEGHDAHHPDQG